MIFTVLPLSDLSDEMNYVSRNIGRDWRQLARILKLHDPDIEQIEEAHPRNLREQSYASLQMWQSMVKELATRDALVKALRRCQNNLLADNIEDGAIYWMKLQHIDWMIWDVLHCPDLPTLLSCIYFREEHFNWVLEWHILSWEQSF